MIDESRLPIMQEYPISKKSNKLSLATRKSIISERPTASTCHKEPSNPKELGLIDFVEFKCFV